MAVPSTVEPRHGKTEPHLDHFAVEDHRHGEHQRHPEPAPEHGGVVAVPAVVGVAPDHLPAAVALVRGRYAAALPVVLTRVCRATSHEPSLLDFAALPGRVYGAPDAGTILDICKPYSNIHTV
jgi:hypothetical protein